MNPNLRQEGMHAVRFDLLDEEPSRVSRGDQNPDRASVGIWPIYAQRLDRQPRMASTWHRLKRQAMERPRSDVATLTIPEVATLLRISEKSARKAVPAAAIGELHVMLLRQRKRTEFRG